MVSLIIIWNSSIAYAEDKVLGENGFPALQRQALVQQRLPVGHVEDVEHPVDEKNPQRRVEALVEWSEEDQIFRVSWNSSRYKQRVALEYEPRNLLEVRISCEASFQPSSTVRYRYLVQKARGSRQRLSMAVLAARSGCDIKGQLASDGGLRVTKHSRNELSLYVVARRHSLKTPDSEAESWDWIAFECATLPDIVPCYAKGFAPAMRCPEELPDELDSIFDPGVDKRGLEGITVGPGASLPSTITEIADKLSQFSAYLRAGLTAGWVLPGLDISALESMITASVDAVGREDRPTAVAALRQLAEAVRQMAAGDPPTVTSEMEALLALNASVLADTLERMSK